MYEQEEHKYIAEEKEVVVVSSHEQVSARSDQSRVAEEAGRVVREQYKEEAGVRIEQAFESRAEDRREEEEVREVAEVARSAAAAAESGADGVARLLQEEQQQEVRREAFTSEAVHEQIHQAQTVSGMDRNVFLYSAFIV